MKVIENPESFRDNVSNELMKKIKNVGVIVDDYSKMSKNLEKGIYNYCIVESGKRNIVKKWDNEYFIHVYIDKLRSVFTNMDSKYLIESINEKKN